MLPPHGNDLVVISWFPFVIVCGVPHLPPYGNDLLVISWFPSVNVCGVPPTS